MIHIFYVIGYIDEINLPVMARYGLGENDGYDMILHQILQYNTTRSQNDPPYSTTVCCRDVKMGLF